MPDLQARKFHIPIRIMNSNLPDVSSFILMWIEVKRPGGKVSVKQATWHQLAQKRGETVLVADSVEEVAQAIGVTL